MKGILLFLLAFIPIAVSAQDEQLNTISSAGETYSSDIGYIDWTIGEFVITSFANEDFQLDQGFQQSTCVVTSINKKYQKLIQLEAFPNPVKHKLTIKATELPFDYIIVDLQGQELVKGTISEPVSTIDFSELNTGVYFLHSENTKILKIVKH